MCRETPLLRAKITLNFHLPIIFSEPGWVAETFSERIRIDFQLSDQLILIGCYGSEYGFRENERFMIESFKVFW